MSREDELFSPALPEADGRRFPRFLVDVPVMRKVGSTFIPERAVNLSFDGLAIAARDILAPGQVFDLVLSSPEGLREVPLQVRVEHVRASKDSGAYLTGLKITRIDPRAVPAYQSLLFHLLMVSDGRRLKRRLELKTEGLWRAEVAGAVPRRVTVVNLSEAGSLLSGENVPASGARGELILVSPLDGEMAGVPAEAVWCRRTPTQDYAGVRFHLSREHLKFLSQVLRGYLFSPRRVPSTQRPVHHGVRVGAFELGSLIGRGGMCDVYRGKWAEGKLAGQPVALKRLRPEAAALPGVKDRFLTEADLGRMLSHPSIARAFTAFTFADEHWIALELVEGKSLASLLWRQLQSGTPPQVEAVTSIAAEVLAALEHCHGFTSLSGAPLEIIHGDVTPANVLLTREGTVKLTDFGVASSNIPELSETPGFAAKLPYLAPELYLGAPTSPLVDVYQVGVLLYEALTGAQPFKGQTPDELVKAVQRGPVPLSRLNPKVEPKLEKLVVSAVSADPASRPQGAGELLRELFLTGSCPKGAEGTAARAAFFTRATDEVDVLVDLDEG
ncbi:MAG: protein kinase domain-containing protein [Myxococcota bacterium]